MATIRLSPLLKGFSGSFGGLVFRQIHGRTILSGQPRAPRKQSEQQRENRMKFKDASSWAKMISKDPEKKAYYQRMAKKLKLSNAYTAAISDYMRKGEIKEIDTKQYKGKVGDVVRVKVSKKDFAIQKVNVDVLNEEGNVIESGSTVKKEGGLFIYKASNKALGNSSVKIKVTIADHCWNNTSKDVSVGL